MRNEIQYAGRVFSDAPGAAHRLLSGDCLLGHSDLSDQLAADCLEFDVRSGDLSLGAYTEGEPLRYCYQGELIGPFMFRVWSVLAGRAITSPLCPPWGG